MLSQLAPMVLFGIATAFSPGPNNIMTSYTAFNFGVRKAMFSENYQNGKKMSILLKSKKIEEAKPLMKKMSDNYKKLLDYFPDNTKEGFKTEALPSIWENKDEFNALMQKASDDMIKLAKAIDTAEDLRAVQKELMWNNCSACHNRFRAEH